MLGLGHQVGRDHHGFGRGIGQHANLGGAGDHVDAHVARDNLLGCGDKGVARSGDLVDTRNGLGTVRQRGHGLGAAHHIDLVHAAELGRGERIGLIRPSFCGGVTMTTRLRRPPWQG